MRALWFQNDSNRDIFIVSALFDDRPQKLLGSWRGGQILPDHSKTNWSFNFFSKLLKSRHQQLSPDPTDRWLSAFVTTAF